MKLIKVDKSNHMDFIKFYEDQYLNKALKRNSMTGIIKDLLKGKSILCKSVDIYPVMLVKENKIIMASFLAHAHRMADIFQIAFFESAEYSEEAFDMLLDYAKGIAKNKGAKQISASLNIHVNYGLGFLAQGYDKWQSFGTAHNEEFYNIYFINAGFRQTDMVSFHKATKDIGRLFTNKLEERLNKSYKVRFANFKDLKNEIGIYTHINNKAFSNHPFYYERAEAEDLELFKDFKYLLKPENLLFVEKDGVPVGFMLWYPDYNQLMKPSESLGLQTVIKNKVLAKRIDTVKIVEIGVLPSNQEKGAILALLNKCYQLARDKYEYLETGWILDENTKSYNLAFRWADEVHKRYKAYVLDL